MTPSPLTSMEKYEWQEVLGRGAYGVVSLVHEKNPSGSVTQRVAKELCLRGTSPKLCQAAQNEVDVLKALSHTNIVAYHESFIVCERIYIIMEYADAGDLHAAIRRRKRTGGHRFSQDMMVSTMMQCARALRYIHSRHIVHRDVKSGNVLLTRAGGVKLGDFGVARVLEHCGAMAVTAIGTPSHLSPEVCDGKPYDAKADVWSFGVVMFEVLALEPPFQGDNLCALVARITSGEPKKVAPEPYCKDVWTLVHKLLQKDAALRPPMAAVLGDSVLECASDKLGPGIEFTGNDEESDSEAGEDEGDALDDLLAGSGLQEATTVVEADTLSAAAILQEVHLDLPEKTAEPRPSWAKKRGVSPPALEMTLEYVEPRDCLDDLLLLSSSTSSAGHGMSSCSSAATRAPSSSGGSLRGRSKSDSLALVGEQTLILPEMRAESVASMTAGKYPEDISFQPKPRSAGIKYNNIVFNDGIGAAPQTPQLMRPQGQVQPQLSPLPLPPPQTCQQAAPVPPHMPAMRRAPSKESVRRAPSKDHPMVRRAPSKDSVRRAASKDSVLVRAGKEVEDPIPAVRGLALKRRMSHEGRPPLQREADLGSNGLQCALPANAGLEFPRLLGRQNVRQPSPAPAPGCVMRKVKVDRIPRKQTV